MSDLLERTAVELRQLADEMAGMKRGQNLDLSAGEAIRAGKAILTLLSKLERLQALVGRLEGALRPFSEAAHRINYYDTEDFHAQLYASRTGECLHELLDGLEGSPLTTDHLRAARQALSLVEGG